MTKELLQQCLDALEPFVKDAARIDPRWSNDRRRNSLTQDKPLTVGHFREAQKACAAIEQALAQQEPHPPSRLCMCEYCALSFDDNAVHPDTKVQQEQPASVDAYVGAREDAAIWKKRALEAEGLNRKFIAEVNGPTYLGEPVKQEQPAQEPAISQDCDVRKIMIDIVPGDGSGFEVYAKNIADVENLLTKMSEKLDALENNTPTQPAQEPVAWYLSEDSNILGVEWSRQKPKYGRDWTPLYKTAPTQPALSDADIAKFIDQEAGLPDLVGMKDLHPAYRRFARAIEAHCRGGQA